MKDEDDYVMSRLPRRLVSRLMAFQKEGVKFAVRKNGRCLIADEMGLGKTLQAISVAYYYRAEWPLLIIVPSSLRYCWIEELEKWLPGVHPHDINLIRGGNDASDISSSQISIVTYGLLSKQTSSIVREALTNQHFNVIICDESHYIKNSKTASSKAVVPLIKNAQRRILLSGTPALSKPVELYSQIDALKPGGFGSWWQFTARYCDARMEWFGRQKMRKVDGASHLEELQSRLSASIMIRREKKDVLTELPPKQRQKVPFDLKDSSQKKEILNLFEELKPMLRQGQSTASLSLEAATEVSDEKNHESLHRLSLISKLYQLSGEAKIGPVKEYLEMLCDNKSLKFLVFAYHHAMMNGVQQTLYEKKVKFIRIDGNSKPEDRLLYVQQFQSDSDTRVAILSILAAGVGLTFTAAKLVVFAEMYWTPGVMVQCEDRAHRIGQTASLPVHYLVAKGTMDEWVWSAVCKKTIVTSTVLSGRKMDLEAEKADDYQVELLSNADAWIPSEQTDMDFQTFFQSQKSNDQRSILEFFTPPSKNKKTTESSQKRSCDESVSAHKKKSVIEDVVVLDSDEEADQFKEVKKRRRKQSGQETFSIDDPSSLNGHTPTRTKLGLSSCMEASPLKSITNINFGKGGSPRTPFRSTKHLVKYSKSEQKEVGDDDDELPDIAIRTRNQWSCSVCTFLNHSDLPRCEMCDTPSKQKCLRSQSSSGKTSSSSTDMQTGRGKFSRDESLIEENSTKKVSDMEDSDSVDRLDQLNKDSSEVSANSDRMQWNMDNSEAIDEEQASQLKENPPASPMFDKSNGISFKAQFERSDSHEKNTVDSETGGTEPSSKERESSMFDNTMAGHSYSSDSQKEPQENLSVHFSLHDSSSEEDFESTPRTTKRKCFQLDSDNEDKSEIRESNDNPSDTLSRSKTHNPASQHFQKKDKIGSNVTSSLSHSKTGTTGPKSKELLGQTAMTPNNGPKMASTPLGHGQTVTGQEVSRTMSTPAGQETRCLSSSWDLLPCDSPCFNLQLESSSDISNDVNPSIGNNSSDHLHSYSRDATKLESPAGPLNRDDTLPELKFSRKRKRSTEKLEKEASPSKTSPVLQSVNNTSISSKTPSKGKARTDSSSKTPSHPQQPSSRRRVSPNGPPISPQTAFTSFQFCVSLYTGRVYLLNQEGEALNENFLPLDVEMGNLDQLPSILNHPGNLRLVQKFVREWNSLTETKKRLIVKRGLIFTSPLVAYDEVRSGKVISTQRHKTKEDTAADAVRVASSLKGSVRTISRRGSTGQGSDPTLEQSQSGRGYVQAVTSEGVPLCLSCQQPYQNSLLTRSTITDSSNAWNTRFCSASCMDKYWIQTHSSYCREKVYEVEHGICQLCKLDAHSFYKQIKDTTDLEKRARYVSDSKFSQLKAKQKEGIVRKPVEGQFWHVDHIVPVWEGGGMCDIDNMRTLCVLCHQKVTAGQAKKRAVVRRLQGAASGADITAFFQKS